MPGLYDVVTTVTTADTSAARTTNELVVDMHPKLLSAYAPLTPLTTILTRLSSTASFNFRIDWIEKKEMPHLLVVATTEDTVGVSIVVVDNADTLVADTLLYNARNDDIRLVDSNTTSATAITVTIDQGGKTSTVWQSGDVIHVLPPAIAEDDATTRTKSVADANVYNLHQICKLQYGITRLDNAMKSHFGARGSKREELRGQKYREFRIKKEKLIYFGGRATGGTAPANKRMAGGLVHYLRDGTLYKDFGGILTESGFRGFIGDYKDQNPDATELWYFCAGSVLDIISFFGIDKVRLNPMSKIYGLDIVTYKSRGIQVHLVALPLLDAGITAGWGFLLDLQRIRLKEVDRDTYFPEALNVGESEIIIDTYRGVYSLMVANESRHAMSVNALL